MVKQNKKKTLSQNNPMNSNSLRIIVILCIIVPTIGVFIYVQNFDFTIINSTLSNSNSTNDNMDGYIEKLHSTHTVQLFSNNSYFDFYLTYDDKIRSQQNLITLDGVRVEFDESLLEDVVEQLKPSADVSSVVIYPIFTSAAYQEPGFYTYYRGECDESCITDVSFDVNVFEYTSSGLTAQIMYLLGYDFLTDIEVDQNPQLLQNYETVILLHNEYLTKKAFDAISSHPNLIFLFPNALYAEIDVNYDDNTMTLIRGHQYPPPENPANGFDYDIEERFHDFEYDTDCIDWEFIEFENGHHLNCYPDSTIHRNLDILLKIKEF